MQSLCQQFAFNQQFLSLLARDMSAADWSWRPPRGGNSALWLLGHLTSSRAKLWRRLDSTATPEEPWEQSVSMGSSAGSEQGCSAAELLERFGPIDAGVRAALAALTPAQAACAWGSRFPDGSESIAGAARFYFFHESYHLGQLGLLRRMLGKPGFA